MMSSTGSVIDVTEGCCRCCSAMANLDKLKLWDKQIKVTPSKHSVVQMPKEGQPVSQTLFTLCSRL